MRYGQRWRTANLVFIATKSADDRPQSVPHFKVDVTDLDADFRAYFQSQQR